MSLLSKLRGPHRAVPVFGVNMILAWGTIIYAPALLLPLLAKERGWPIALAMGGLSVGFLTGGIVSPWIGKAIDRYGGHYVMACGSLVAALGFALLPVVTHPAAYYAVWALLGIAMASNLYDPAFASLTRIFGPEARRQITMLTLIGGFASTVMWPVTHLLLTQTDWKGTYWIYAAVMALIAAPLHAFLIPREQAKAPPPPKEGTKAPALLPPHGLPFMLVAAAFATFMFAQSGMLTHMLLIYERMGVDRSTAVAIGALFGPSQVAARICELALARHTYPLNVARFSAALLIGAFCIFGIFGISALTAAAFVVLFGAANGLMTIARGTLPLALFGPQGYGHLVGRIAVPALAVQASAPILMALVIERVSDPAALALTAAFIVVAFFCFMAIRRPR
ncbi:MAG: MFS transporter [Xanthobacteraceae bacterium]|nr:MFS transporter [Xanthobacteraceae bacterium]QYK45473.1 MAG: MFS transporter [Xanthobacteraceae bacterium]HMN50650.1 MFS transporter [Xanthobacteraceae bacterium]